MILFFSVISCQLLVTIAYKPNLGFEQKLLAEIPVSHFQSTLILVQNLVHFLVTTLSHVFDFVLQWRFHSAVLWSHLLILSMPFPVVCGDMESLKGLSAFLLSLLWPLWWSYPFSSKIIFLDREDGAKRGWGSSASPCYQLTLPSWLSGPHPSLFLLPE